MKSVAMIAACCAGAQAFVPSPVNKGAFSVKSAPSTSCATSSPVMMAKSVAVPFLESPAALDGSMVGDFGFDPLGLTENINLPYGTLFELWVYVCVMVSVLRGSTRMPLVTFVGPR